MADFYIWTRNLETTAPRSFLTGQDVDPDFDNNDFVDTSDFLEQNDIENYGATLRNTCSHRIIQMNEGGAE